MALFATPNTIFYPHIAFIVTFNCCFCHTPVSNWVTHISKQGEEDNMLSTLSSFSNFWTSRDKFYTALWQQHRSPFKGYLKYCCTNWNYSTNQRLVCHQLCDLLSLNTRMGEKKKKMCHQKKGNSSAF